MSKNGTSEAANRAAGKVAAIRVKHDATDIVFALSGKGKKSRNRVFQVKSSVLCSLVLAAYAKGDKLHVEHMAGSGDSPLLVMALRIGAEPDVAKKKTNGKAKPSLVAQAAADA